MIVLRPADISGPLLALGNLCSSMLWGLPSFYDASTCEVLWGYNLYLISYVLASLKLLLLQSGKGVCCSRRWEDEGWTLSLCLHSDGNSGEKMHEVSPECNKQTLLSGDLRGYREPVEVVHKRRRMRKSRHKTASLVTTVHKTSTALDKASPCWEMLNYRVSFLFRKEVVSCWSTQVTLHVQQRK